MRPQSLLPPRYRNFPTHGLQCADVYNASRIEKRVGISRIVPHDAFGAPLPCSAHVPAVGAPLPTLVISGSPSCFERVRRQLAPAQLNATWLPAVYVESVHDYDTGSGVKARCRDRTAQRTIDGVVRAHRAAWKRIVQSNTSALVLEEDAELVGAPDDVHDAVRHCAQAHDDHGTPITTLDTASASAAAVFNAGCDVAYLAITGDFFSSVACARRAPRAHTHARTHHTPPNA